MLKLPPSRTALAGLLDVSPDLAFAIRFAAAVSAAIWIAHAPGLVTNESQWILITVLMVMQPMSGGSLLKGLLRAVGTLAAAATAILLFGLYAQTPPLLLAGLFLVQLVSAYGFTGPRYQYAWFVFAFTTAIVLGDALAGTGEVETLAFQRGSAVGVGLLIVFAFDALLWPRRAEPSLRGSLAARARQLAPALRVAIEAPLAAGAPASEGESAPSSPLMGQLGLVSAVRTELGEQQSRVRTLAHLPLLLEAVASRERILRRKLDVELGSASAPVAAALSGLGREVGAALDAAAEALAGDRAPATFAADLERALLRLDAESKGIGVRAGARAELEGRVASLHDLVALLRRLEEQLTELHSQTSQEVSSVQPPAPVARRLHIDPFRVQIALRTAIAVCAAFLLPMVLGWEVNTMVAPVAFMVAAKATRGGVTQSLALLAGIVGVSWLLADLALVFVTPHIGRLPLALAYPAAVAGVFAYVSRVRPQLALLPSVGALMATLPVFSGLAAPTDVYGSYSTVSYLAAAMATAWVATRALWPATASSLFRERVAAQLELCLGACTRRDSAEGDERRHRAEELLSAYTRQSEQLGPLHTEARHEPVERALDDERRTQLLTLTQDLFDATLGLRGGSATRSAAVLERAGDGALAPLREAALRADEALIASIQASADVLRGDAARPPRPDLARADEAVQTRLQELEARPDPAPVLEEHERQESLVQLSSRRQLVTRQLAIEAWLADWLAAERAVPV